MSSCPPHFFAFALTIKMMQSPFVFHSPQLLLLPYFAIKKFPVIYRFIEKTPERDLGKSIWHFLSGRKLFFQEPCFDFKFGICIMFFLNNSQNSHLLRGMFLCLFSTLQISHYLPLTMDNFRVFQFAAFSHNFLINFMGV
jgi:hypothetical protein